MEILSVLFYAHIQLIVNKSYLQCKTNLRKLLHLLSLLPVINFHHLTLVATE